MSLLGRVLVPTRLALIRRGTEDLAYNPAMNVWHRVDECQAEVLRWLRSGRAGDELPAHIGRRFELPPEQARDRVEGALQACLLRRLLYLDVEPPQAEVEIPENPLATVYWICTQACNLRCTYCYQDALVARPGELTTEEARTLIDQVVESGARTFIFTGGEPFVRRDLLELARYSKSRGLRTNVITNGYYVKRRNIAEIAATFDLVSVSFDHGLPEHHDRHRGTGSWARSLGAIDLLIDAGVKVDVNSVLSRLGLRDVDELLRWRRSKKIGQLRIVPQFPMGRGGLGGNDELTPDELIALGDELSDAGRRVDATSGPSIRPPDNKGLRRSHCGAGLSEVSVDPEGWVYPCKLLQYPQYRTQNVRDAELRDIYRSHAVLRQVRSHVTENLAPCKTCLVKHQCGGGCRGIHVSFSHEYTKAHPLFCAYIRRTFEVQAWQSTGAVPPRRVTSFRNESQASLNVIPIAAG